MSITTNEIKHKQGVSANCGNTHSCEYTQNTQTQSYPNSAYRPDGETVGTVGDTVNITSTERQKLKEDKKPVDDKIKQIIFKCQENGIGDKDIYVNILKELSISGFEKMSNEEQLQILEIMEIEIDEFIELVKNNNNENTSNINPAFIIAQFTRIIYDAMKEGSIKNAEEINANSSEDIKNELGDDFNNLSEAQKKSRFDRANNEWEKRENNTLQHNLKHCKTEHEKESVRKEHFKRHRFAKKYRYLKLATNLNEEMAAYAVKHLDGKDMDFGINAAIKIQKNTDNIADNIMNAEYVLGLLDFYHQKGEVPPKEVLEEANRILVSFKTYDGAKQYEKRFYQYRQQWKENGQIPPYLTDELITAMSSGIGTGISFNEKMTLDQKVECLCSWDEHASKFEDYYLVKKEYNTNVKQYLEEHPEAKQGISELYIKYKQEYGKTPDIPPQAQNLSKNIEVKNLSLGQKTDLTYITNTDFAGNNDSTVKKPTLNEPKLISELRGKTINEVLDLWNNDINEIADIILANNDLSIRIKELEGYFDTLSAKNIAYRLQNGTSNLTKGRVIAILPREKANDVLNIVAPIMTHDARKNAEKQIESGNKHAVS